MKRFWTAADVTRESDGWGVSLDGRPLRTPARAPLEVPSEALARAIADEWNGVEGEVDPRDMPLTGLANAAIDRVAPDTAGVRGRPGALRRGRPRLLSRGRAAGARRAPVESWDPLLDWARRRFDVDFATTCGVIHVPQPPATVDRLGHAVAALDPFRLAGLSPLVTIGGSLVAALAVIEKAITPEEAWEAVSVDERWQLEQWGADAEAEAGAGQPPPRLPGRRAVPGAAGRLVLRPDEVADERDEADLPGALEPFGGDDRANLAPGIPPSRIDQHIFIFGPVADLVGGAAHPVGDHFVADRSRGCAGAARARPSRAAG